MMIEGKLKEQLIIEGQYIILAKFKAQIALEGYSPKNKQIYLRLSREHNKIKDMAANNTLAQFLSTL